MGGKSLGVGLARYRWPDAEWIIGNGVWASAALCGNVTIMLFETEAEAATAKSFIDGTGCSGGCTGNHQVVRVRGPGPLMITRDDLERITD